MKKIPSWHFPMLNDQTRNNAFKNAIVNTVGPGDTVLDIGTGTGFLSILCARQGADVVTFESNTHMFDIARDVIEQNGLSDRISMFNCRSDLSSLPETKRANILVTEIFDCAIIGEAIRPALEHAQRHLLTPDYVSIPQSLTLFGALLESTDVHQLNHVDTAAGIDVSRMNRLRTQGHFPLRLQTYSHRILSNEVGLYHLDLTEPHTNTPESHVAHFTAKSDGVVAGVCVWFEAILHRNLDALSTQPEVNRTHWMQGFIPFDVPVELTIGQTLDATLDIGSTEIRVSEISLGRISTTIDQPFVQELHYAMGTTL